MSPDMKRAMIKRDHPELSISQQCKLVRLSRSAFYYTPVGINADTLAMMKEIDRVFTRYPFLCDTQNFSASVEMAAIPVLVFASTAQTFRRPICPRISIGAAKS